MRRQTQGLPSCDAQAQDGQQGTNEDQERKVAVDLQKIHLDYSATASDVGTTFK